MTEQQIQFVMYVTGHDRETVMQLWEDWSKYNWIEND